MCVKYFLACLVAADLTCNSHSARSLSPCWCWGFWQAVLDQTGVFRVGIQNFPDYTYQVCPTPYSQALFSETRKSIFLSFKFLVCEFNSPTQ